MASALENSMVLWSWPFIAAKLAADWMDTVSSAVDVIHKRVPIIAGAVVNPLSADHREMSRMVTEKTDAFGSSQRSVEAAHLAVRRATEANTRAFGRMMGGEFPTFFDWAAIVERNLEIASVLVSLPTKALKPIHATAAANDRRLRRY